MIHKKIELGNYIKLKSNKTIDTAGGKELFLKDTIGVIIEIINDNCFYAEMKDSDGIETFCTVVLDEFEIIDK